MSEWWTYRLSDFLMFSPRTYGRLVELHNATPAGGPLLALAGGAASLWLVRRARPGDARALAVLLAAAWAWVAWAFLWRRYSDVFLAGPYLALAFAAQAVLLLAVGLAPAARCEQRRGGLQRAGWGIALAAIAAYPLLAVATGLGWRQAELFGWMPDPTALGTLGLLLASGLRARGLPNALLLVLPVLGTVVGAATQWVLRS